MFASVHNRPITKIAPGTGAEAVPKDGEGKKTRPRRARPSKLKDGATSPGAGGGRRETTPMHRAQKVAARQLKILRRLGHASPDPNMFKVGGNKA